jgi:uncharacterized protein (TIGR03437 family)
MKTSSDNRTLWQAGQTVLSVCLTLALASAAWASGTFGTVVSIGGHASDIALDETRGVLYIANYTANRIEIMNTSDRSITQSINVPFPGSLAISRDGNYLVVSSYGNFATPSQATNTVTIISLADRSRQTLGLAYPPLGVAFGADGLALVLTTNDVNLLDPGSATYTTIETIASVAAKTLPVVPPDFPSQIQTAALGVSGDGQLIYGLTDNLVFSYSVATQSFFPPGYAPGAYAAAPPLGPRLVSVNNDGSVYATGWAMNTTKLSLFAYQFTSPSGALNIGSHAIDSAAGLIYAQVPDAGPPAAPPTTSTVCLPNGDCITLTIPPPAGTPPATLATPRNLMVADLDNLTVRQRLLIPENLAGRSILNRAADTMYSISDSGVTIFPIGAMKQTPQLAASQEDVVFQGTFCDRHILSQQINIVDPNGGHTDFRLSLVDPAMAQSVSFSQASGVTPATVTISIDPTAFQGMNGTTATFVRLDSNTATNLQPATCPLPVAASAWANGCFRLLLNNPDPDERGSLVNVPGTLVDMLPDPSRNRFYIVRQDKNQVLVFDGSNYSLLSTLRTSSTPMQMAITRDSKYLLVGHNDAQLISVFDLDSMQALDPIRMPFGHYPRSVATAGGTILAASHVSGPVHQISYVDFNNRTATPFPTLGAFQNSVNADTVLVASPLGNSILAAMPDGNIMLYDVNAGTFTVARKDLPSLSGAYAASDLGQFVVDNNLFDSSLVRVAQFDQGAGGSSGFSFMDRSSVLRTTGPVSGGAGAAGTTNVALNAPGRIERLDLNQISTPLITRTIELPRFPSSGNNSQAQSAFIRSLAPLANRNAIISLTQSGFTALQWNFDATTTQPQITGVVGTANQNPAVTAGGLVSILGSNLGSTTVSSSASPAPTVLGSSCVTVNGTVIPLFLVSQPQINGQLPLNVGSTGVVVVYTPGGVSNPFTIGSIPSTAPTVLQVPNAPDSTILVPAVFRESSSLPVNLVDPVHKGDHLIIYATGLGPTDPAVDAGVVSPSNPAALVLTKPVVTLSGVSCPVTFAGLTPGQIGVYQIDVNVPQGVSQGLAIPLTISQGTNSSTVYVRVVQ